MPLKIYLFYQLIGQNWKSHVEKFPLIYILKYVFLVIVQCMTGQMNIRLVRVLQQGFGKPVSVCGPVFNQMILMFGLNRIIPFRLQPPSFICLCLSYVSFFLSMFASLKGVTYLFFTLSISLQFSTEQNI